MTTGLSMVEVREREQVLMVKMKMHGSPWGSTWGEKNPRCRFAGEKCAGMCFRGMPCPWEENGQVISFPADTMTGENMKRIQGSKWGVENPRCQFQGEECDGRCYRGQDCEHEAGQVPVGGILLFIGVCAVVVLAVCR
jgi:hypothetical protein